MRRPGDKVVRKQVARRFRLSRVLGVAALFSAGYGNVGSSIYYALGIVAVVAVGATPIALALAGLLFVFTALTYAEGISMYPEAGGSSSFARHAFNDLAGFLSGWALILSYVVTISLSAFTIPPYLGYLWAPLKESPVIGTIFAVVVIALLMFINVRGVKESSRLNISATLVDVATQLSLIILGLWLILRPNPGVLWNNMFGEGNFPEIQNLVFGVALAALAYTGVETVSQMSEETKDPKKKAPRALILMIFAVLIMFAGISIVALSAMTPQVLGDPIDGWARDPVAGIAANLRDSVTGEEFKVLQFGNWDLTLPELFAPLVSLLAATILLIATNAGVIGISRLAFSLGTNRQLPATFSKIHRRFKTPYISVMVFGIIAILILLPGFFTTRFFADLGGLYTFGSLLSFAFAHSSIIALRMKEPRKRRAFRLGLNIRINKREVPLTAILGLVATLAIWIVIVIVQPYARNMGFLWMLLGLIFYLIYRRQQKPSV